jgi:hypothetical protein
VVNYFRAHPQDNNISICLPLKEKRAQHDDNVRRVFANEAPCRIPGVVLQKSHDFLTGDTKIVKDKSTQYLLLYRNPMASICSHYKLYLESDEEPVKKSWKDYVEWQIGEWNSFMEKWFFDASINTLKIEYDALIEDPCKNFSRIINYMAPEHLIIDSLLRDKIAHAKIAHLSPIEEFEHYDKDEFQAFEAQTLWARVKHRVQSS